MPEPGNLIETLRAAADHRLDAPALVEPGGPTITYGALFDRAARLARVLADRGVTPGDRVLVTTDKSPDTVALYLACLHAGAVHTPLNPAFTADEQAYFVGDADPALTVGPGAIPLETLVDEARRATPATVVPRDDHDLAALLYTSGTTGRPKGAALTHANLRHNAFALHEAWRFEPDDHLIHSLPLFHVHGLFVALHCSLLSAVPMTFLRRFDVDAVIEALADATVLMGVPTHYHRLLGDDRFDRSRTAGMRLFTCGSAPLPAAQFDLFSERTGHRLCERYGMSEAGIMTSNPYDGERLAGTVGFALRDVEIRVRNRGGSIATDGEPGDLEVRGPHLFREYWGMPEATAAAHTDDGWFVTGDVGSMASDGRITLQGRAGDMIISGGENVYPREIERVLDEQPGIVESAVVGVPHPDFGEAVVAVLVADDDHDSASVDAALAARLARYKHPKATVVVDALPRNAMGKVQKAVLRDDYAELFTG
ncbi:MAG: AMP-binding protein [Acidimicrobiales bacterium]|nr:AMP-binding protein [Acidimicrobiales bacterium]